MDKYRVSNIGNMKKNISIIFSVLIIVIGISIAQKILAASNGLVKVDHIRITVYYTEATPTPTPPSSRSWWINTGDE